MRSSASGAKRRPTAAPATSHLDLDDRHTPPDRPVAQADPATRGVRARHAEFVARRAVLPFRSAHVYCNLPVPSAVDAARVARHLWRRNSFQFLLESLWCGTP